MRTGPCTTYAAIKTLSAGSTVQYLGYKYINVTACAGGAVWAQLRYPYGSEGTAYVNPMNVAYCGYDKDAFYAKYIAKYGGLSSTAKSGLFVILDKFAADSSFTDARLVAYILATIKHECGDTWMPIEEYGKGAGKSYGTPVACADPIALKTCTNTYYGRGYVQLTWCANYKTMSTVVGAALVCNPSLALSQSYAYTIITYGMMHGSFTGAKLTSFITASSTNYYNARTVVNGYDKADVIKNYAIAIESMLRSTTSLV